MKDGHGLTRWEMRAFMATSVLAGVFLALLAFFLIVELLAPLLDLPQVAGPAAAGSVAFLLFMWTLYPALWTQARLDGSAEVVSFRRLVLSSLFGLVVGASVFIAIRAAL